MRRLHTENQGFSAVTVIIAIVVIILAAAGGWYAWHAMHSPKKPAAKASSSSSSTAKSKQHAKQAPVNHTLSIKEWDVSFKYGTDATLQYKVVKPNEVDITSTQLLARNGFCTPANGGVGGLVRAKADAVTGFTVHGSADAKLTGTQYVAKYPHESGQIGDYVYTYFIRKGSRCVDGTIPSNDTVYAVKSMFV